MFLCVMMDMETQQYAVLPLVSHRVQRLVTRQNVFPKGSEEDGLKLLQVDVNGAGFNIEFMLFYKLQYAARLHCVVLVGTTYFDP